MNNVFKTLAVVMSMLLLAACASPQYIISTNEGMMITSTVKPKLDEKTGMYSYKDAAGKTITIRKEDVKQIMER